MKLSWTSLKISIAGAKLSHLVQKDRIWDHGSMAEQARMIFCMVHKAKANGNIDSLKKQCSVSCFEKFRDEVNNKEKSTSTAISPVIKELAIVNVQQGKNNKPDMFCSMIWYHLNEAYGDDKKPDQKKELKTQCWFIRQGDWWLLNKIK
jgi:hypothetical protein